MLAKAAKCAENFRLAGAATLDPDWISKANCLIVLPPKKFASHFAMPQAHIYVLSNICGLTTF
jgi:hypothetical protein